MAFVAIPGLIALVPHASGGAILSTSAGGYVAGTLIPASVVAAAPAIAVGAVAVTAAVAGAYFYIHGVPLPLAELLATKGVAAKAGTAVAEAATAAVTDPIVATKSIVTASSATAVIAVPAAKVVLVLMALAAVGYVAYTSSEDVKDAIDDLARKAGLGAKHYEADLESVGLIEEFKATLSRFMAVAHGLASETAERVKDTAKDVADSVSRFSERASEEASAQMDNIRSAAGKATQKIGDMLQDLKRRPE